MIISCLKMSIFELSVASFFFVINFKCKSTSFFQLHDKMSPRETFYPHIIKYANVPIYLRIFTHSN